MTTRIKIPGKGRKRGASGRRTRCRTSCCEPQPYLLCSDLPAELMVVTTGVGPSPDCDSLNGSTIYTPSTSTTLNPSGWCASTGADHHCFYDSGSIILLFQIGPNKTFARISSFGRLVVWEIDGISFPFTLNPSQISTASGCEVNDGDFCKYAPATITVTEI